ncbi:MAG: ABC transporter permease [Deltaproteobacteria bacterium]|jgi:ABC-2 type transport system permease protein|nr:ABC transporter permease [Deltaproteobacteria bacterium]
MRIIRALIKKEFIQIVRDPSALMIAFFLPILLLFIFGYGVNLDVSVSKLGLAAEGSGPETLSLISSLTRSEYFDVTVSKHSDYLTQGLLTGRFRGLMVLPEELEGDLLGGRTATIQIVTDGSETNSALFVRNHSVGLLRVWLEDKLMAGKHSASPLISVQSRFWYNPELKSRNYLIPGSLAIVMTLIGVMLTSMVISREWERGTMEALMASPVSINQIILSKLCTYYLLSLVSVFFSWSVAVLWYEVPFRGSLGALLAVGSIFVLGALGQGLLISTLTKNQFLSAQWAMVTGFLPSFMLSGFVFEVNSLPPAVKAVSYAVGARYFVPCLQTLFLTGNVWPLFARSAACMAVVALVFFVLTSKKIVKKVF